MEEKTKALINLLIHATKVNNGVHMVSEDGPIVDYILDVHGDRILSAFEQEERNTGVALMFHDDDSKRDLILVFGSKNHKEAENNGLVCFIVEEVYDNPKGIQDLIEIMGKTFESDPVLLKSIVENIHNCVLLSTDRNASEKNN